MNRIAWLGSMASQVFALLLVGIIAAAGLAFAVSDVQRREAEERGRLQRVVDRVVDLRGVLDAASPGMRPGILGPGPEAPRLVDVTSTGGSPDLALTNRLNARLGAPANAVASDLDGDLCGPRPASDPPPRPPDPSAGGPPRPPSPDGPRPPPATCRLVALTLDDGQRIAVVIPTGPKSQIGDHSPLSLLFLLVLVSAAALLAFVVARVATGPLRRLAQAAAGLGRDLDRSPLVVEGPLAGC